MQRCAFTPYEGKKPYIFISYAHKDSDRVFPILEELDRRGYRVWYDDGIAPGSEWPENIAQHLSACSLTMAFISPNSIASDNCRREVTFALSKRKPFLGIILQPTEMSLGMEMQLSAQQCIMKYTYTADDAFYQKVCSCPDLAPCLGQPKLVPAPAAPAAAPTASIPAAPVKPQPTPKPVKEKKPLDKKMLGIIGGAAAALVILAVILIAVLSGGDKPDDAPSGDSGSSGTTNQSQGGDHETELYYSDQEITAADAQYISSQSNLQILEMVDCTIQAGALDQLKLPAGVTHVRMEGCTGISDLQFLADLTQLNTLQLTNCGLTDDMLPELNSEALSEVWLNENPELTQLSAIAQCPNLLYLYFQDTGVSSVECLGKMEQLCVVDGSRSDVTDISPLAQLEELISISFSECGIETISVTFRCLRLSQLDLSGNLLTDISAFENCTVLQKVDLSYNDLQGASILAKSAGALEILSLSGNNMSVNNLYFVKNCTGLKELYVDCLMLFDLDIVSGLTKLERLSANACYISDLSGLAELKNLEYLSLAANGISDISALSGMSSCLEVLDLSFNTGLKDLSMLPMAHYEVLNLMLEYVDLSTLPHVTGTALILIYEDEILENTWLCEGVFEEMILIGLPLDKVVAVEDMFGKENVLAIDTVEDYCLLLDAAGLDYRYLLEE